MSSISHNPFATPQLSPQNTSASLNLTTPGSVPQTTIRHVDNSNDVLVSDSIPDEAPPPYTLSADMSEDETPVQRGPSPTFQAPSSPINVPRISMSNESQFQSRNPVSPPLPPRRPQVTIPTPVEVSPPSPLSARPERPRTLYSPPLGPPPTISVPDRGRVYSPPLGPPVRRAVSASGTNNYTSTHEENRPTSTPVPGHPLLLHNNLLVYPPGYECSQCKNVGYKNNDPSHPCNKCWNKYARPYSGALAYAPFPSQSESGRPGASNFQRPLPKLLAPHVNYHSGTGSSSNRTPAPAQRLPAQARLRRKSDTIKSNNHQRSESATNMYSPSGTASSSVLTNAPVPASPRVNTNYTPAAFPQPRPSPVLPRRCSGVPSLRPAGPSLSPQVQSPSTQPLVLRAGDPRLGGRLCWRCDGRGSISYFLLDTSRCEVCNGIGRTFN